MTSFTAQIESQANFITPTNTGTKSWGCKVIPERTKSIRNKTPETRGRYAWCWWSVIGTSLSNYCTLIYQNSVRTVHAQSCIRYCELQGSVITADSDIRGKSIYFVNGVTTRYRDKPDEGRCSGFLYLEDNNNFIYLAYGKSVG